jgi:hypothetical protein
VEAVEVEEEERVRLRLLGCHLPSPLISPPLTTHHRLPQTSCAIIQAKSGDIGSF